MWTLDTRVEVTPAGRYVNALRREDRLLGELQHPGKNCSDPRVRRIAVKAEAAADTLRGSLRDELARCGALSLGDVEEPSDRYGYPLDYDAPNTPTMADLCAMEPERELLPEPSEAEMARFYREDAAARNFSDGRGECGPIFR